MLVLHRARELLVRQRTMLINAIRGHCAEFGIIAPQGASRIVELIERVRQAEADDVPELVQASLSILARQLDAIAVEIHALERRLLTTERCSERRLSAPRYRGFSRRRRCAPKSPPRLLNTLVRFFLLDS